MLLASCVNEVGPEWMVIVPEVAGWCVCGIGVLFLIMVGEVKTTTERKEQK